MICWPLTAPHIFWPAGQVMDAMSCLQDYLMGVEAEACHAWLTCFQVYHHVVISCNGQPANGTCIIVLMVEEHAGSSPSVIISSNALYTTSSRYYLWTSFLAAWIMSSKPAMWQERIGKHTLLSTNGRHEARPCLIWLTAFCMVGLNCNAHI